MPRRSLRFVSIAATQDVEPLSREGFATGWIRRDPAIHAASISRSGENTKLEWVAAAYGRREPRDIVDLITIHETILPLGAAVWASAVTTALRRILGEAEEFVLQMPTAQAGLLYLHNGKGTGHRASRSTRRWWITIASAISAGARES